MVSSPIAVITYYGIRIWQADRILHPLSGSSIGQ